MFIHRQKQKGMVLICAVAILAVLSIMATSFVRMMTLNLQAAKNHLNYVDAKFAAIAGIENAKAIMWQYMLSTKWNATTGRPNPVNAQDNFWYPTYNTNATKDYRNLEKASQYNQLISLTQTQNPFSYSGVVGNAQRLGRYEFDGNTYALKIKDNQGKLNLNSHRPYNNNAHNGKSNQVMNTIIKCLADQCGLNSVRDKNGNVLNASQNVANRLRPTGATINTLSSMSEVEGYLDEIISGEDDDTVAKKLKFLDNVCITSMMDSNCYALTNPSNDETLLSQPYINDLNTQYYREYRSPVNINTASVELIAALIQAIKAQVYVYMPKTATSENPFNTDIQRETTYSYYVHTYNIDFSSNALTIATFLKQNDKVYHSMLDLESEIQKITNSYTSYFPTFTYNAEIMTGNSTFWSRMYYNICGDILKANFNPNIRENFFNPDFIYRQYATKSNLHSGTTPTYSTEFCFETYGHIDIQSIGKITANNKNLVVASSVLQESVGFSSIISLTTYHDFKTDGVDSEHVFPYNDGQDCIANRKASVGYIQAPFLPNAFTSCPPACHTVYDGIMMQEIYCNNNQIKNPPTYSNFKQFNITDSPITSDKIYETSGRISFWFKATENAHSPFFCSFFSASHINTTNKQYVPYPVQYSNDGYSIKSTYNDGIQMFVYKNSQKQIIISRLFFCGYFNGSGEYVNGIKSLAVDVDSGYLPGQATCMVNGTSVTNKRRKYARVDCIININSTYWCENEWNSLDIEWNDTTGYLHATLTLDNGSTYNVTGTGYGENTQSQPKFCIINETNPQSNKRIQINGMDRSQVKSGADTTGEDGRLFILSTSLHLPGNCTMNNLTNAFTTVARTIEDYTDTMYIPLNIGTDTTDPNKNPFLNTNLKPETTWGIIGGLNWISYPESSSSSDPNYIRTSIVNYNNVYTSIKTSLSGTNIHTDKMSMNTISIPYSHPSIKKIIRKSDGNKQLKCDITMTNAPVHPTILDSISLQILYPYTVSSSILQ